MDSWASVGLVLKSRLFMLLLCIFSDFPFEHEASDVAKIEVQYSSKIVEYLLRPFKKWDSVYYIQIARDGYTKEQQLAFFPLYPMLIKLIADRLPMLENVERIIVSGLLLNTICFVLSYFLLYGILKKLKVSNSLLESAMVCFMVNPANVFFTTVYTESLFCFFSWLGIYLSLDETFDSVVPPLLSIVPFFLASCTRSNGSFNAVYVFAIAALRIAKQYGIDKRLEWSNVWKPLLVYSCILICIFIPFTLWSWISYHRLCDVTNLNYIGSPITMVEFCSTFYFEYFLKTSPYAYIQRRFWDIGPFHYYHWRQIPNFMLALPITIVVLHYLFRCMRVGLAIGSKRIPSLWREFSLVELCRLMDRVNQIVPIALCAHLIVLFLVGYVYSHVQIITRLLCSSSPLVYVAMGRLLLDSSWSRHMVVYLLVYNIIGTLLHVNHFPWT